MKYRVEWLSINGEWQDSYLRFWFRRRAIRCATERGDATQPWRVVDWSGSIVFTANAPHQARSGSGVALNAVVGSLDSGKE